MTFESMSQLPYFYYVDRESDSDNTNLESAVRKWALDVSSHFPRAHKNQAMVTLQSLQLPEGISDTDIAAVSYFTAPLAKQLGKMIAEKEESASMAAKFTKDESAPQSLDCYAQDYFPMIASLAESVLSSCSKEHALNDKLIDFMSQLKIKDYPVSLTNSSLAESALMARNQWSKKIVMGEFKRTTDIVAKSDIGEADIYAWRAQSLHDGPIFIKPDIGAIANDIMKVELTDDILSISSIDEVLHSYLLAASDKKLQSTAFQNLEQKQEGLEHSKYFSCVAYAGLGSVEFMFPTTPLFNSKPLVETRFENGELKTTYHSPERFFDYDVISDGDTTLISGFNSVKEVLEDIATYYDFIGREHYAEQELVSALTYNGRPVEARVIVQRTDVDEMRITGTYFKSNGSSDFNCITGGSGFGVPLNKVLCEAQRNGYLPGLTEREFMNSLAGPVVTCLNTTSKLLHRQVSEHLPNYPFQPVGIDEVAFDFIYVREGDEIRPMMMDFGFNFGTKGMDGKERAIVNRSYNLESEFNSNVLIPYLGQTS